MMKEKVSLIILRLTRYSDRHDIALALAREQGPVSFIVSASRTKGAARTRALMMPMSIVGGVLSMQSGRSVGTLSEVTPLISTLAVTANPVKSAVAMFMADLLAAVVREGVADTALWDFTVASMEALASIPAARVANFPPVFILNLATILGIAPDSGSYTAGRMLDLRDGVYRLTVPHHPDFATAEESRVVAAIDRLGYRGMHHVRLTRDERNRLLDGMLRYISMHHTRVDALRSLPVLRSLF